MSDNSIYSDIAKRTGGDIYIGELLTKCRRAHPERLL